MPYRWTQDGAIDTEELHIWPHESLAPKGMAAFVLVTFSLILLPAFQVIGTPILWGLLPFLMAAVWAIYYALQRNHRDRQINEVFKLTETMASLVRTDPNGAVQEWQANRYWTRVRKYETEGPVPQYITLKGEDREVEIGAFLSEEERLALYDELRARLS